MHIPTLPITQELQERTRTHKLPAHIRQQHTKHLEHILTGLGTTRTAISPSSPERMLQT